MIRVIHHVKSRGRSSCRCSNGTTSLAVSTRVSQVPLWDDRIGRTSGTVLSYANPCKSIQWRSTSSTALSENLRIDDVSSSAIPLSTSANDSPSVASVASVRIQLPQHYSTPRRASFVEDRVAAQQLPFMERTLAHVLAQPSYDTVSTGKHELRKLYLYWLSKPVRDLCRVRNFPDKPLQSADCLLQWMMHQFDAATDNPTRRTQAATTLEYVLRNTNYGESVNAGLCRLLSLFLQPLQGTNAALQDHGRRTEDTAVQHVASLRAATQVYQIMQRLHADNVHFPSVQPDAQSYQSILNLYGKRCKLLVLLGPPPRQEGVHSPRIRRGVKWSAPDTIVALGGWTTPHDCIAAALDLIDTMSTGATSHNDATRHVTAHEGSDTHRPAMIHYSMLLSMMSYAAGMEGCEQTSLAQQAWDILQRLEADPSFDHGDVNLYNPVLLAFGQEATYLYRRKRHDLQQRAQRSCETLWRHMKQSFVDDETMSADPITYSIMLKLYRDVDQAEKAQAILDTMEAAASETTMVYSNTLDPNAPPASSLEIPTPTLMHYNTVLNALAKSTRPDSGERAMMLLRRMEEQTTIKGVPLPSVVPRPDRISYTSALDAVLRGPNVEDVIDRMAVVLLERFEANEESHRRPDAITYNVLFHTLFRRLREHDNPAAQEQIAEKMENLLRRLKRTSRHFRAVAGSRVFRYYNDCLLGWACTRSPHSGERALQLLREMEEDGVSGKFPSARPNGTTYQAVLASICRIRTVPAVQAAIEILEKMEASNVPVTVTALNSFLGLLLNCRFEGSANEADDTFVEIIMNRFRAFDRDRDDGFTAGWVFEGIFTHLNKEVNAQKRKVCAQRFEKLFRALLNEPQYFRLNEGHGLSVYYNKCLKAWAFARTHESTSHALDILREMEERASAEPADIGTTESCRPNGKSYEYILTCLSRSPDAMSVEAARKIFRKLDQDGEPVTLAVLNRFIRILVKSGVDGCYAEAEQILRGVEDNYFKGKDDLCLNESTYSILVDGYLRSPSGVRDATRILQHMRSLYETTKNTALLPSVTTYRDLMQKWSHSPCEDAMEQVEQLFVQMTLLSQPTAADYGALQAAWSKSSHRHDAPQRVEGILVRMQQEYESGINRAARPTVENFCHVIVTWASSAQPGSAEHADAILQHLEDLSSVKDGIYRDLKPTTECYEAALLGWTNSDSPQAGERALAILDRMKQIQRVAPSATINQDCYHYVILALAKANMVDKAYAILKEMQTTFDKGQNRYSKPTHESFRAVLSVCATCTEGSEHVASADVTMSVMREYLQFAGSGARKDVWLQFLYTVFRAFPVEARDEAVRSIFCDARLPCPAHVVDTPAIRDALEKTVSPATFNDIVGQCNRMNPLLSRLLKSRLTS